MAESDVTRSKGACLECGVTPISGRKFCSSVCSGTHWRKANGTYVPPVIKCRHCQSDFDRQGGKQKYCSDECKKSAISDREKAKRQAERTPHNLTCETCGNQFQTFHKKRFCSQWCSNNSAYRKAKKAEYKKAHAAKSRPAERPKCAGCFGEIPSDRQVFYTRDNWCSDKCRLRARRLRRGAKIKVSYWDPPPYTKLRLLKCGMCGKDHLQPPRRSGRKACNACRSRHQFWVIDSALSGARTKQCDDCGVGFSWALHASGCSVCPPCIDERARRQKRAAKSARRARMRGNGQCEQFDPFEIFERDGWRCKRCGTRTPKRYRGTLRRNAPELDHIIPVSLGGPHTRANTQCLCRSCNIEKSNDPAGDQLLMFG